MPRAAAATQRAELRRASAAGVKLVTQIWFDGRSIETEVAAPLAAAPVQDAAAQRLEAEEGLAKRASGARTLAQANPAAG